MDFNLRPTSVKRALEINPSAIWTWNYRQDEVQVLQHKESNDPIKQTNWHEGVCSSSGSEAGTNASQGTGGESREDESHDDKNKTLSAPGTNKSIITIS